MDKRYTFNEDERNYDTWRPKYCPELFADIIRYAQAGPGTEACASMLALEIGCGTGQATEPFLAAGCSVMAIELGDRLAQFVQVKFRDYPGFSVRTQAFEDFDGPDDSLDLVYSATAFHWIPEEIGYPNVFRLLKSGGTMALFWNKPGHKKDDLDRAIQDIYDQYIANGKFQPASGHKPKDKGTNVPFSDRQEWIANTILQYGFVGLETHIYRNVRSFSAKDYCALLDTYSDHRSMKPEDKTAFYGEIRSVINRFGGTLSIHDTMDLYLAKKP